MNRDELDLHLHNPAAAQRRAKCVVGFLTQQMQQLHSLAGPQNIRTAFVTVAILVKSLAIFYVVKS